MTADAECSAATAADGSLKVLVVTLEFTYSPFSGNGMYARSVVRSLLQTTDICHIAVLCARPHRPPILEAAQRSISSDLSADHHILAPEITSEQASRLELWPVGLPPGSSWKKLDEHGPWEVFASGAARQYAHRISSDWKPNVVLVVDWHGGAAWRFIVDKIIAGHKKDDQHKQQSDLASSLARVCYFNFRVYSSGLCPTKADWYEEKEREALELASDVVCLSRPDMKSLERLMPAEKHGTVQIKLIHPALRGDMHCLAESFNQSNPEALNAIRASLHPSASAALGTDASDYDRKFITCAVRLSKEKNPLLFVQIMGELRDTISELGFVPLLCGAASDEDYAAECREVLLRSCPNAVIVDDFLGPEQLASIFAHSVINFHPCLYDAFGMTAVEAAAFGAPSIINTSDVGATELMGENGCLQVYLDLPKEELAAAIRHVLLDNKRLEAVRKEAYQRAMSWDEEASGNLIMERLKALA